MPSRADRLAEDLRGDRAIAARHLQVIALASALTPETKRASIHAGIDEIIMKPMSPKYLVERVLARLKGKAAEPDKPERRATLRRKDWTGFARGYNGPGYEANRYHEKLASAHARFARAGVPDLGIRATQLLLFYHGFDPGPIDGVTGQKTREAVAAFTGRHGLSGMSAADPELMAALLKLPAAGAA